MTPKQVRARIEKRVKRCDVVPRRSEARAIVERAAHLGAPKCPGWRLFITPRNNARLVACAECNALAPARLRVDDKMVRSLPEADEVWKQRNRELQREKEVRQTTTHYTEGGQTAFCGRDSFGWTTERRRRHVRSYTLSEVDCSKCLRLAALTPAQRAAEKGERSAALRAKFADKNAEAKAKKEAERVALRAEIETARPDAMVCLDIIEQCGNNLDLPGSTHEQHELLGRCLALAVEMNRFDNPHSPNKESRRWKYVGVFRGEGQPCCRFCNAVLDNVRRMGTVDDQAYSDHTVPCALRALAGAMLPRPHGEDKEE